MMSAYNPYWWMCQETHRPSQQVIRGVFRLATNGVTLNSDDSSVDYGVSPTECACLPQECIVLLTISAAAPDGGDDYPVYILLPGCGTSTLCGSNGVSRVPLLDDTGAEVTGAAVSAGLMKLALLDRRGGTVRYVTA